MLEHENQIKNNGHDTQDEFDDVEAIAGVDEACSFSFGIDANLNEGEKTTSKIQ